MSTTFYDNSADVVVGTNLFDAAGNFCTLADSFSTPAGTLWTITTLQLKLQRTAGAGTSKINVDVYLDNGASNPGSLYQNLATNFSIVFPDGASHLITVTLGTPLPLGALTRYWIAVSDPTNTGAGGLAWNTANLAGGDVGTANESNAGLPAASAFCAFVSLNNASAPFIMKLTGDVFSFGGGGSSPVAIGVWGR